MLNSPLFHGFGRRVRLSATLRCETALRIGCGKTPFTEATDLPVMRDATGRPLLPGSSLKGAIRAQVEAILRAQGELQAEKGRMANIQREAELQRWACDPIGQQPCCESQEVRERREQGSLKKRTPSAERAKEARVVVLRACYACRIFGAPGLQSHVMFSDARVDGDVKPEPRHGVALDRDLARAASKRKYEFEVMPIGSCFPLRIDAQALPLALEGALVAALDLLGEGYLRLGGFRSRGMGQVTLVDPQVELLELQQGRPIRQSVSWAEYKDKALAAFSAFCETGEVVHA